MKTLRMLLAIGLGLGILTVCTILNPCIQAFASEKGLAPEVTAVVDDVKEGEKKARIPAATEESEPLIQSDKVIEPSEKKAEIPGRAGLKPFKPLRKSPPEPGQKMAIIP